MGDVSPRVSPIGECSTNWNDIGGIKGEKSPHLQLNLEKYNLFPRSLHVLKIELNSVLQITAANLLSPSKNTK